MFTRILIVCGPAGLALLLMAAAAGVRPEPAPVVQAPASQPAPADPPADEPPEGFAHGIVGSPHDFSAGGSVPRDLCLPCHTPHITAAQAPLLVSRSAAEQRSGAYRNRAGRLNEASLVCLSCHDGTVARDVYAGAHAMNWSEMSAAGLAPGRTRLTNHPVGIPYPVGNAKYNSAEAVTSDGQIKLPGGLIQCTTCHDPHNTNRHPHLLVIKNDRSRLCLSCHRL